MKIQKITIKILLLALVFSCFPKQIQTVHAVATLQKVTVNNLGLVGRWSLDGSDLNWGTGAALDTSGQGNTGTLTNMSTSTTPAIGKIGQALRFDGSDDYISLTTDSVGLGITTVCGWINLNAMSSGQFAIMVGNGSFQVGIRQNSGTYQAYSTSDGGATAALSDAISNPVGVWNHLCVTRRGTVAGLHTFFINGVQSGSTGQSGGPFTAGSTGLVIGRKGGSADYWPGLLDEVRVYNTALTQAEITTLYNIGR